MAYSKLYQLRGFKLVLEAMTSQYLRSKLSSFREYITPITHHSTFTTTGEITPAEFVQAGDYLTYRFPTWQWSPADKDKSKDFLPHDKQFLVTRHVPSYVRASDYEVCGEVDLEVDDNWVAAAPTTTTSNDVVDQGSVKELSDDDPEVEDIDELIDENAEDVQFLDSKISRRPSQSGKRFYDLYISYSTSYRVPKMYLVGFDADNVPLTPGQMFEDIASDYRHKTVTIEKLPFMRNTTCVSIHPCKHANVMKILMRHAIQSRNAQNENTQHGDSDDDWQDLSGEGIRVDQYLVVFLKFMASVTPGIEYDYTMDAL